MVFYKCVICDKPFNHRGDYERHLKRKNPCKKKGKITKFKCQHCYNYFHSKSNLNRHIKNHCTKVISEEESSESSKEESEEKILKAIKIKCKYCNKEFAKIYNLNRHLKENCRIKKQIDELKEGLDPKLISYVQKQNEKLVQIEKLMKEIVEENKFLNQKIQSNNHA